MYRCFCLCVVSVFCDYCSKSLCNQPWPTHGLTESWTFRLGTRTFFVKEKSVQLGSHTDRFLCWLNCYNYSYWPNRRKFKKKCVSYFLYCNEKCIYSVHLKMWRHGFFFGFLEVLVFRPPSESLKARRCFVLLQQAKLNSVLGLICSRLVRSAAILHVYFLLPFNVHAIDVFDWPTPFAREQTQQQEGQQI